VVGVAYGSFKKIGAARAAELVGDLPVLPRGARTFLTYTMCRSAPCKDGAAERLVAVAELAHARADLPRNGAYPSGNAELEDESRHRCDSEHAATDDTTPTRHHEPHFTLHSHHGRGGGLYLKI